MLENAKRLIVLTEEICADKIVEEQEKTPVKEEVKQEEDKEEVKQGEIEGEDTKKEETSKEESKEYALNKYRKVDTHPKPKNERRGR